jgi:alpha-beta hydrolase superfamily lysophospholipase
VAALAAGGCDPGQPPQPPQPPTVTQSPIASCVKDDDQQAHGVTLPLPNNGTLEALHYGSGSAAVVLAEEYGGDACQWHFNAQDLASKGYQTVIFNYEGSADKDVLAAIDFVRSQGAKRVFLLGSSKGGTAVLTAASEVRPPVSGVVSLSAPKTFEDMNALAPMSTFATPVIFIIGDNDAAGPDTKLLYQRCASKDKQLIVRPGGFHGVALMDTDTTDLVENFFASH